MIPSVTEVILVSRIVSSLNDATEKCSRKTEPVAPKARKLVARCKREARRAWESNQLTIRAPKVREDDRSFVMSQQNL